ncbi:AMP-binding protein [Streptomyces sp. V1I1]|uniref:AMP-binding protein n=1 Tax=Streptomyces sp. V1I1 TaxID=3042272 RepID=UPI00277DA93C|nr:AMP-binding protein [Streptomyces sp. V1I1]MDQ0939281.1 fatty-acyl-CoA synthase [Streptomyces sp. V1I1]
MAAKAMLKTRTFDPADMAGMSIAEGLEQAGSRPGGLIMLDDQLLPHHVEYAELNEIALNAAKKLQKRGIAAGDRVCLLSPTSLAMVATLFGLWRLGAVPVVLPSPQRGMHTPVLDAIRRRIEAAVPSLAVTTREWAPPLGKTAPCPVVTLQQLHQTVPSRSTLRVPTGDAPGLLQFASGTTAASRAVLISQDQLVGSIAATGSHMGFGPADRFATWLPLHHPLGIVPLAGIVAGGAEVVMMTYETFVEHPSSWLRTISDYQATVTAAPNFAYSLAARTQQAQRAALNLRGLRVALNGTEAIDAEDLMNTVGVLQRAGMPARAMCPLYGLAEATLAVSAGTARKPVRIVAEAERAPGLTAQGYERQPLVSCGSPVDGVEVEIRDDSGTALPPGAVGQIVVRGPGVTGGYWRSDGHPGSAPVRDGWLHTGDMGFMDAGELVVCGREKEMLRIGGRTLHPAEYERAAECIEGVRAGKVVAFALPDRKELVVVAEAVDTTQALLTAGNRMLAAFRDCVQHVPREVVFIRPGTLPKSSGERQRQVTRARYLSGSLDVVHTAR